LTLVIVAASVGCDDGGSLIVDLRSDYVFGVDFVSVRCEYGTTRPEGDWSEATAQERSPDLVGRDLIEGVRIGEFDRDEGGPGFVRVKLYDSVGAPIAERIVAFDGEADYGLTVVMSRSCADRTCTDPAAPQCQGGRCVPEACSPERADLCGTGCANASDCDTPTECAEATCAVGECFARARDDRCEIGFVCDLEQGCVSSPDGDASVADAGLDADADTGPDAAVLGPFDPPRRLTELFDGASRFEDPALSPDGLELIYTSTDAPSGGFNDLWVATRATVDAPWSDPRPLDINSAWKDQTPSLSADALTLWFSSGRDSDDDDDIFVSTRAAPGAAWTTPVIVTTLSSTREDRGTSSFAGEQALMFGRADVTTGPFDLFVATRASTSEDWDVPTPVTELNGASDDRNPAVTPDGTLVYFASDRPGTMGRLDIWRAERADRASPWGTPTMVPELSSAADDDDPSFSADRRIVVFSSDRDGVYALYEASR
jgi:hypothetical protein